MESHSIQASLAPPGFPRLFVDLKFALSTLYSLPLDSSFSQQRPTPEQAHNLLIEFQSRNIRRRVQSIHQQFRDQQKAMARTESVSLGDSVEIEMRSSWWASLALLLPVDQTRPGSVVHIASPTERLFAAQTLLHRLRRMKLDEAIDLDIEKEHNLTKEQVLHVASDFRTGWLPSYLRWLSYVHPVAGSVVQAYVEGNQNAHQDEERLKGEITLLTLAVAGATIILAGESRSHPALLSTTMPRSPCGCEATICRRYVNKRFCCGNASASLSNGLEPCTRQFRRISSPSIGCRHGALFGAVAALPETLLSSPGGARGRLSMDPRMVQTAIADLLSVDRSQLEQLIVGRANWNDPHSSLCLIHTCERWAKYVHMPLVVLQQTLPWVCHTLQSNDQHAQRVSLSYLIAIYESASCSVEHILSTSLGLSQEQRRAQPLKKRQSSRSKKRQKEILEDQTTDASLQQAHAQVVERGELACQATMIVWEVLSSCARHTLTSIHVDGQVDGEGPVGCLAACANACLPHLLRHGGSTETFQTIAESFRDICSHVNKQVRALSLEPLFSMHTALLDLSNSNHPLDPTLESVVVDHFYECSMSMASSCGYPSTYFEDMGGMSDEELEIERNDVRELLRVVAGSGEGGSTADVSTSKSPAPISIKILGKLLVSCQGAVQVAFDRHEIVSETAVHAFSSLAKPLNHLAKYYSTSTEYSEGTRDILRLALLTQGLVAQPRQTFCSNQGRSKNYFHPVGSRT